MNTTTKRLTAGSLSLLAAVTLAACGSSATSSSTSAAATPGGGSTGNGASSASSGSSSAPSSTSAAPAAGSASGALSEAQVIAKAPVAGSLPAGSPTLAAIKKRGTLKVGTNTALKYFAIQNPATGKYSGFDADLAQMLAKYILGTPKVAWTIVASDTRESLIQNGTIDTAIATYTITPQREAKVAFAGPYYISGDTIMVKKGDTSINKVSDLNGKSVATEAGVGLQNLKRLAPKAKPVVFDQLPELVQALQEGRASAVLINAPVEYGLAATNPNVTVTKLKVDTLPFGIGLPKNDPTMKKFVNTWLHKIESDGEWAALWKATIGKVIGGNPPTPPTIGKVPAVTTIPKS